MKSRRPQLSQQRRRRPPSLGACPSGRRRRALVLDVEAGAGRADEGAGAAAEAAQALLLPDRGVEALRERDAEGDAVEGFLEGSGLREDGVLRHGREPILHERDERLALLREHVGRVAALRQGVQQQVAAPRVLGSRAERGAEAGLVGRGAGDRDDGRLRQPRVEELVPVVPVEEGVERPEGARLAGADAEDDRLTGDRLGLLEHDVLAVRPVAEDLLDLGEDDALRRGDRLDVAGRDLGRRARPEPSSIRSPTCAGRQDARLLRREGGEERLQGRRRDLVALGHCPLPDEGLFVVGPERREGVASLSALLCRTAGAPTAPPPS